MRPVAVEKHVRREPSRISDADTHEGSSNWVFLGVATAAATSSVPLMSTGFGVRLIVGDLVLIATILLASVLHGVFPRLGPVVKWAILSLTVSFVVVCSAQLYVQSSWFSLTEMLLSSAKLLLYACAVDWFAVYLRRQSFPTKVVRHMLTMSAFATLIQFAVANGWVGAIPYIENPNIKWDRFSDLPRLYGFFSEPSTAAIFYLAIVFVLLQSSDRDYLALLAAVLMTIATFAMSAFAIGLMLIGGWLLSGRVRIITFVKGGTAAVLAILLASRIAFVRAAFDARVIDRVVNARSDASTVSRVADSWEAALRFNPARIFGIGPGQFSLALIEATDVQLDGIDERIVAAGGAWNIYANLFVEFGIVGVVGLMTLKHLKIRGLPALVLIYGSSFATGVIFGWLFWFVFSIAAYVRSEEHESEQTDDGDVLIDLTKTWEAPMGAGNRSVIDEPTS